MRRRFEDAVRPGRRQEHHRDVRKGDAQDVQVLPKPRRSEEFQARVIPYMEGRRRRQQAEALVRGRDRDSAPLIRVGFG